MTFILGVFLREFMGSAMSCRVRCINMSSLSRRYVRYEGCSSCYRRVLPTF